MKPMLASPAGPLIPYPMLLSPKLDGIRCLIINGVVCGRSLKPIPNRFVQQLFGRPELNGLDGELIVGPPTAKEVIWCDGHRWRA
jgi:DNA ligase 1